MIEKQKRENDAYQLLSANCVVYNLYVSWMLSNKDRISDCFYHNLTLFFTDHDINFRFRDYDQKNDGRYVVCVNGMKVNQHRYRLDNAQLVAIKYAVNLLANKVK